MATATATTTNHNLNPQLPKKKPTAQTAAKIHHKTTAKTLQPSNPNLNLNPDLNLNPNLNPPQNCSQNPPQPLRWPPP